MKYAFIGPILRPAQAMGSMKRLVSLRSISTSRLTPLHSHVPLRRSPWPNRYASRSRSSMNLCDSSPCRRSMNLCVSSRCRSRNMPLSLNHSRSHNLSYSRRHSLLHQRRNPPLRQHRFQSRSRLSRPRQWLKNHSVKRR